MFSVYGETGRLFKGAMEDLRQVTAVRPIARSRPVAPLGTPAPGTLPPAPAQAGAGPRGALAAYAQAAGNATARQPLRRVADVMSHGVVTLAADLSVLAAWQLLVARGVGQAPVVDAQGRLVGLLSRAELLQPDRLPLPGANSLVWHAFLAQPVAAVMWTPVPAVAAETDLRRVARVLLDTHLPGLPVVSEEGAVSGFISRSDILRAVVNDPPLDLWS